MNQKATPLLAVAALGLAVLACQVAAPAGVIVAPITAPPSQAAPPTPPSPTDTPTRATDTAPTRADTPTDTPQACQVHTGAPDGWLNVRSCAGVACQVIGNLPEGATVAPLGDPGPWRMVQAAELTGWVYSDFLRCNP